MVVYTNLASIYAALGDPTRMQILAHLKNRPQTCSELVGQFDLTQQAIGKHIGILNKAGLLSQKKIGRSRICELVPHGLEEALKWISDKTKPAIEATKPIIGYGSVAIIRQGGKILAYHAPSH